MTDLTVDRSRTVAPADRPGRGRQLDDALTRTILDETLRMLDAGDYASLRIERVAAAVGCSKASIYRRWASRAELVADALRAHSSLGAVPDHGDVVADLVDHAWRNELNQRPPGGSDSSRGTLWAVVVEPEVRELFWTAFLSRRRSMGRSILRRAVDRGQLPADTDHDAVLDMLAGVTFYRRSVRNKPLSRAEYRRIVSALVTSPPRKPARRGR